MRKLLVWGTALAAAAVVGFVVIHAWIALSARGYARRALERFPGDAVEALIETVDCDSCRPADRTHAAWALGQAGDRRALPVLRRHYTGGPCDHTRAVCQYELSKAIRHLETGWGLPVAMRWMARPGSAR